MRKDIYKNINSLRRKLHKSIEKNGVNSNETRELSNKIDELVQEYYNNVKETEYPVNSKMFSYYKKSYNALKEITEELKKFPSVTEWNKIAKEKNYLSHLSMEYISNLKWNYLRTKVLRELNMKS